MKKLAYSYIVNEFFDMRINVRDKSLKLKLIHFRFINRRPTHVNERGKIIIIIGFLPLTAWILFSFRFWEIITLDIIYRLINKELIGYLFDDPFLFKIIFFFSCLLSTIYTKYLYSYAPRADCTQVTIIGASRGKKEKVIRKNYHWGCDKGNFLFEWVYFCWL